MPDYIFLLESRLSPEQRAVLLRVQELARSQELNIYLAGGAVRDLITGLPIRDLDFIVEGNPFRMVRELEKGGARVLWEDERLRRVEMIFPGEVDGSIAAAREEFYERPGARPELRWATAVEDLRHRDFSINAIAISLNPASRGLLLDPTNGLADLERREVRALSIHAFTNQPIRLMRILRYCVRMGFKVEGRTQEWFDLAIARGLHENVDSSAVGDELRQLGREDHPAGVLKQWEQHGLVSAIHPQLARRHPDYDGIMRLIRARDALMSSGIRPRLAFPVIYYVLNRLKGREPSAALRNIGFRADELGAFESLVPEAQKSLKFLKGSKTKAPRDAYLFLAGLSPDRLAFLMAEFPNTKAMSKIRAYLNKWRPLRSSLPAAELEALGVPRGTKFNEILEGFFDLQLRGKGRTPEDRTRLLKKLAGIKDEPKKIKLEKKKGAKTLHGPETPEPVAKPETKGQKALPKPVSAAAHKLAQMRGHDKTKHGAAQNAGAKKRARR